MSSPSPLALLHRLDKFSPEFHDQLCIVLYGEEYRRYVKDLQGDGLAWFVDHLDKVLHGLDHSSPTFRKCLRELKSICGTSAILPTSFTLSSDLLNVAPSPFAGGGSGDVYKGTLNGSKVCVKRIRMYTKDGPQKIAKIFCQEAVMWKHLSHPNIVPLLGITIAPPQLISNWMSGGDLPEYIGKHSGVDRLKLLSDVAKGLYYLHSCSVIHGDLKGQNILMDDSGNARIADFGFTTVTQNLNSAQSAQCQRGFTPRWTAPEVLDEGPHSKESDVFSFAMVMIEIFTGAIPFSGSSSVVAMLAITQGRRPQRPTHPTFTEDLWTLMQRCWNHDPLLCPEVSEVLQVLLTPGYPAWKQLISHTLAADERISLITTIFSDHNQIGVVEQLSGDDAQTFIDTIDEALETLTPGIRRECLHYLRRICGDRALLPRSLAIPLCYDPREYPLREDRLVDVRKSRHQDLVVAAKVFMVHRGNNIEKVKKRFCQEVVAWRTLRHENVLPLLGVTMTENLLVMVSKWAVNGNIVEFVKGGINSDRKFRLLEGATSGLIYMHGQGIIHGDLRGVNILIDDDGRACLTGFGLATVASDQPTIPLALMGDRVRWSSPERLHPERFNLKERHPTQESDCYALGMVTYEVLSGLAPFSSCTNVLLLAEKILGSERPEKPPTLQGEWSTTHLWGMLGRCWESQPDARPSLNTVLQCLQSITRPSRLYGDQPTAAVNGSGFVVPHRGGRFPVSPHMYPPDVTGPTIPAAPAPLRQDDSVGGWVGKLARNARKMFEVIARKFRELWQPRRTSLDWV